jgi:hypothetical protein
MPDDNRTIDPPTSTAKPAAISLQALLSVLVSFASGAITALVVVRASAATPESFSVAALLSFLFGIALSAASIVLALAAISLGRTSEKTMIDRSDQSIRMQNEVFLKTTEALSRIESSTGVTEKRIEDIIAGRAGAISGRIAERLSEDSQLDRTNREIVEREIRESLLAELGRALPRVRVEDEEAKARAREHWEEINKGILSQLAEHPATRARKIGKGKFVGSGDDLADGVFDTPKGTLAVAYFSTNPLLGHGLRPRFDRLLDAMLVELARGYFQLVYLIFDGPLDDRAPQTLAIQERRAVAREDLFARIRVFAGSPDEIREGIRRGLEQIATAA